MNFNSLITFVFILLVSLTGHTQQQENYDWSQVRIGGGGYITGIKIHPNNNKVAYFRTDVGGLYRWDEARKELVQVLNYAADKKSYYGVAGVALHPTKENIIYIAVDRGNRTETSKILYSENYGKTWLEVDVTQGIKFGANGGREGGTGFNDLDREGNPLTINPNNTNEVFVGTREKGLWVLDLTKNQKWRKINSIPDNTQEASIRNVVFHPTNPNVVYVGYAQFGIYRSTNAGASFTLINNGFNDLREVADISLSKEGTKLYVAARRKGIYRLTSPENGQNWEKLTLPFTNIKKGYQTVTASPHDDNVVMAAPTVPSGRNLARLQVSTNSGSQWQAKSNINVQSNFKWRSTDHAGAYVSQIAFDPHDANKLYLSCWFGLWHTDNWNAGQVQWRNDLAKGHEEIVNSGLKAFPVNANNNTLVVNSADSPAIVVTDPNSYDNSDIKDLIDNSQYIVKGQDIAICESYPNNYVISSTRLWEPQNNTPNYGALFYTTNGGENYIRAKGYDQNWAKSLVAISAQDPSNIVVAHGNKIHYSEDRGATFKAANHPSLSNVVDDNVFRIHDPFTEDLVLNGVFYIYDRSNGHIYRSENKGKDWSKTASNLPVDSDPWTRASLKAVPGKAGHIWFNHPSLGLYFTENKGDSWKKISAVKKASIIALGKAITTNAYPTLYMVGRLNSNTSEALYRSTDQGSTWSITSNADTKFLLASPRYMAADRNEFGKVYIGISGMGVWQGVVQNDNSDPDFIEITSPSTSVSITPSDTHEITWNTNINGNVRLALFKGGDYVDQIEFPVPNNGSYTWSVPNDLEAADDYQIRVRSIENEAIDDFSEFFSIANSCKAEGTTCDDGNADTVNDVEDGNCNCTGEIAYIEVNSPTVNTMLEVGAMQTISWNSNSDATVRIALWKGNAYHSEIEDVTANDGTFDWTVPNTLEIGDDYQVRVRDFDHENLGGFSEKFSIIPSCANAGTTCDDGNADTVNDVEDGDCNCAGEAAYITVNSPTANSVIEAGSTHSILWNSNHPGDVRVVLFKGGNYVDQIEFPALNTGSYSWSVPNDIEVADDYQIRVRSIDNDKIDGYSEFFSVTKVRPECDLIPNGIFENGNLTGWSFKENGGASGTFSSPWNKAQLSVTNPGTEIWHLRIDHDPIALKGGSTYELNYKAKAWNSRNMSVFIEHINNDYEVIYHEVISLENELNQIPTATFTMPADGEVLISFRVGTNTKTVILDDITLNEQGCTEQSAYLGIQNSTKKGLNMSLYPNPVANTLQIDAGEQNQEILSMSIHNLSGVRIKSILPTSTEDLKVDVTDLASGIYIIKVNGTNWQSSKLFLVVR